MQRIVIIGSGAAGMAAAYKFVHSEMADQLDILIIDEGKSVFKRKCPQEKTGYCHKCTPCAIMSGVGGAGTYSSGLLNLTPFIGGDLTELFGSEEKAWEVIEEVDRIYLEYGAPEEAYFSPSREEIIEIKTQAERNGISYIDSPQRLIGTDNSPGVIDDYMKDLEGKGVKFKLNCKIKEIKEGELVTTKDEVIPWDFCLAAPGRSGMQWLIEELEKLEIETSWEPLDIGVRIEVPSTVMEKICSIQRDPKFHIHTPSYDDFVRTFCTNHTGFVVTESYPDHVGVNGHSFLNKKSNNTNFAFLVRVKLTEPLFDTTAYGKSIAVQATILGDNKPILQRLGDLRRGRRSTWSRLKRSIVEPTLKSITPGDIAMALPARLITDVIEGLEKLDRLIPGVASDSTLIYAPEIKYSAKKVDTDAFLETSVTNLYVAGDGAGISRGIVAAAATGLLVAEGILSKISS